MTDQLALSRLRALEPELKRNGIASLYLFGSLARGEETAESDVDLFCDLAPDSKLGFSFYALADRIAEVLGRRVELTTREALHPLIRNDVAQSAVRVF
ncbi:MAG: nucleotidyltransferase domain-containing protein [Caulobacterales bacterium]|jgi:predicted nucleotidyltransferase|nr:nucleotidyltransferase domain-containing protein [Caulobacterales bacterium]